MKRTQGTKLTGADKAKLRAAFYAGRNYSDAADEVNCTPNTASRYYRIFRNYAPLPRGRPAQKQPQQPPAVKPSRFYTSNFEL